MFLHALPSSRNFVFFSIYRRFSKNVPNSDDPHDSVRIIPNLRRLVTTGNEQRNVRTTHGHEFKYSQELFRNLPLRQFGFRTGRLEYGRFPSCCLVVCWTSLKLTLIKPTLRRTLTLHESPETNMPWLRRPLQIFKLLRDRGGATGGGSYVASHWSTPGLRRLFTSQRRQRRQRRQRCQLL